MNFIKQFPCSPLSTKGLHKYTILKSPISSKTTNNKIPLPKFHEKRHFNIIIQKSLLKTNLPLRHGDHSHGFGLTSGNKAKDAKENAEARTITIVGLISNLSLAIIKGVAGTVSNSTAMIADAAHSVSDLSSDLMTLWAVRYARMPPTVQYPRGFGKYESVGTFAVGGILIATGLEIAHHALEHITSTEAMSEISPIALYVAAGSILFKEILFQVTNRIGQRQNSQLLIANAWHHRTDVLSSVLALVGIAGSKMGLPLLDPISALLVAGMIMRVGFMSAKGSIKDLTDQSFEEYEPQIRELLKQHKPSTSESIVAIYTQRMGPYYVIELTAEVDPTMNIEEGEQVSEEIRSFLLSKMERVHEVIVHIRPKHAHVHDSNDKTHVLNDKV